MRTFALIALSAGLAAQGPGGPGGPGGPNNPLAPIPVPAQNPITPEKAILGKLLFWEEQMSTDNRVACGTCHTFSAGGGDSRRSRGAGADGILNTLDDVFASPGVIRSDADNDYMPDPSFGFTRQVTGRQSPSFLTAAWFTEQFWDGRAGTRFDNPATGATIIPAGGSLENQALGPILSSVEMAHDARTFLQAVQKLRDVKPMALATNLPSDMAAAVAGNATYPDLFQAAFGSPAVTAARVAMAIATYERTLVPDQTPYDQFIAGNLTALTPQQVNGLGVFNGPGRCNVCHTTGLFADDLFHNLGLRPIAEDNGRQGATGNPAHAGQFKTPSLRNVGLRNSFMHNGEFTNLQDVFTFYLNGGGPNLANKSPLMLPLNVPPQGANDLINFLQNGLTDPRVANGLPPFDRPTLRSDILPNGGNQSGIPTVGSGGRFPIMMSNVPANLGNIDFKVGVNNAVGGAPATFVMSIAPGLTQLSGIWINVSLNGSELLVPWVMNGTPGAPGEGYATLGVGLPNAPALAGLTFYTQWFIWDGGAPNGAAATRAGRLDLF